MEKNFPGQHFRGDSSFKVTSLTILDNYCCDLEILTVNLCSPLPETPRRGYVISALLDSIVSGGLYPPSDFPLQTDHIFLVPMIIYAQPWHFPCYGPMLLVI